MAQQLDHTRAEAAHWIETASVPVFCVERAHGAVCAAVLGRAAALLLERHCGNNGSAPVRGEPAEIPRFAALYQGRGHASFQ